jgi:hypothetical protein
MQVGVFDDEKIVTHIRWVPAAALARLDAGSNGS